MASVAQLFSRAERGGRSRGSGWGRIVLDRAVAGGEPGADLVGIVMEWAHAASVRDAAGFVDDVEAFRPGGVGVVGGVVEVVDAEGDRVVEAFDEIVGDGYALAQRLRLRVADVVLHVGLHLP